MKAIQASAFSVDSLAIVETPAPQPGRGDVCVKVAAVREATGGIGEDIIVETTGSTLGQSLGAAAHVGKIVIDVKSEGGKT